MNIVKHVVKEYVKGEHVAVIKIAKRTLELPIPTETIGIWREGTDFFALSILPLKGTATVTKYCYNGHSIYKVGKVTHVIQDLEELWDLKKPYTQYAPRAQFDMALNKLNDNGELVPCV